MYSPSFRKQSPKQQSKTETHDPDLNLYKTNFSVSESCFLKAEKEKANALCIFFRVRL